MRHHEFNINDPFQRQRRKRSGVNNDLAKIYQQDVDKPMIARIEEKVELIDAQGRMAAARGTARG